MNGFAEPSALPSSISLSALNRSKSRSRRLRLRLVEQSLNCVSDIGSAVDVGEAPRCLARHSGIKASQNLRSGRGDHVGTGVDRESDPAPQA